MPIGRQVLTGKPVLAAGQRDKPVTIQQRQAGDTATETGFPVDTWTTLASTVWMSRTDLRADENFRTNQVSASSETQWHLAYREDMDPEIVDVPKLRRLVYRGRTYDIVSGTCIGRREGIELITLAATAVS